MFHVKKQTNWIFRGRILVFLKLLLWSSLLVSKKFAGSLLHKMRSFILNFLGIQALFEAQRIKKWYFLVLGALFGPFWVPQTSPTIMILFFSVSYIKINYHQNILKVWISWGQKSFTKKTKTGYFWPFFWVRF